MVKNILARIWAIWGIIWFIATMLVFFPFFIVYRYLLSETAGVKLFVITSRIWMGIYLPLIGCPLRIYGRSNFKPGTNYIVVCNHNSLMDVPVTSPGIPGPNKTIAKKEFAAVPIFGIIYQLGSVIVDRKSERSRRDSYQAMKKVLELGINMCIYPEGTRNKTNEPLKSFHDGAFRLAIETGKPIMPAILFNTKVAMPPGKPFYLWPVGLKMHFLEPVVAKPEEDVKHLKESVFSIMQAFILNNK